MKNDPSKFEFNKKWGVFLIVIFVLLIIVLCVVLALENASSGSHACIDGKGCKLGIRFLTKLLG